MRKIQILRRARRLLKKQKAKGICIAIRYILNDIDAEELRPNIIFPELSLKNAEPYRDIRDKRWRDYWWTPGEFGLFSGRRRFFRWLMKQYKNDKTEIKEYKK